MSRVVLAGVAATALVIGFNPLKQTLNTFTNYPPASGWILVGAFVLALAAAFATPLQIALSFAWNCFFKPLGKSANQQGRLDQFYQGQAESRSLRSARCGAPKRVISRCS